MRSLYETPLYSPCSISIRQLSTYWNELYSVIDGLVSLPLRRIGIIYAYGPKTVITDVLSDIDFL